MPRPNLGGRIEEQGLVSPPARTSSSRLILELPPPIQEIGLPSAGGLTNSWSLKKIAHSGEPSLAIAVPSASEGGGQVGKPEQYRRMAAQCLHLARVVRDAVSKAILLKMAETWVKLAERLKADAEKESV